MTRRAQFLRWFVPAALLFAAGFAVATRWDLPITKALYNPGNLFARLMEAFGWLPAFVPVLVYALLWANRKKEPGWAPWQPVLGWVVALCGFGALYHTVYGYLAKRGLAAGFMDVRSWLWLALGLGAAVGVCLWVRGLPTGMRGKIRAWALCGSVFMVANQVAVNLVKMIWQRTRFDTMIAAGMLNFEAFTPWVLPFGNGGSSFPSGHTANMAGIFMLVVLCDLFPAWNRRRKLVYALCWAAIAVMAFARLMIGRHFLSDTLAAAALVAGLFYALRRSPVYKQALKDAV